MNETPQWDQCAYMRDQVNEIEKHKWIESEKVGYDLGKSAVMDWIKRYAKDFREYAKLTGKYFIFNTNDDTKIN